MIRVVAAGRLCWCRSCRRWCRADQWHADPAKLRALLADPQLLPEDDLIRAADLVAAASGKQWAEAARSSPRPTPAWPPSTYPPECVPS